MFVKTRTMSRAPQLAIALSILAVIARLIAIDQPYIDMWNSWRESDVAAIARNYFVGGFHFAYPQIDWAGDQPGYVGTEFPILPFAAAITYKFTGVHEWVGRLQAVILFVASLPFFFLLVREAFNATAAVWATFFYSFAPLEIMTSRCFMPDAPSLGLAIIGLYFFLRWIDRARTCSEQASGSTSLFAAAAFISLSILIKLPTVIIGVPLLYLAWQRFRWKFLQQATLWIFAVIALLPAMIWYWHAYQIAQKFYPHHFFGAGGIRIENFSRYWTIAKLVASSTLTPLLLVLAAVGIFIPRTCPERQSNGSKSIARLFHTWLIAMIFFIVIVGYGNRHQWYQLPLVPIAAAFAGNVCAFLGSRFSATLRIPLSILLASAFGFLSFFYVRPFYRPVAAQLREAGLELKKTTSPKALVVAADNGDPTIFYYAERKGWHFLEKDGIFYGDPSNSQQLIVDLEQLRGRGATHLVFTTNTVWWLDYYREFAEHVARTAARAETNSQFQIYELRSQ